MPLMLRTISGELLVFCHKSPQRSCVRVSAVHGRRLNLEEGRLIEVGAKSHEHSFARGWDK